MTNKPNPKKYRYKLTTVHKCVFYSFIYRKKWRWCMRALCGKLLPKEFMHYNSPRLQEDGRKVTCHHCKRMMLTDKNSKSLGELVDEYKTKTKTSKKAKV